MLPAKMTKLLLLSLINVIIASNLYSQSTYYVDGDNGNDSRSAIEAQNPTTPWRTYYNFNHTRGESLLSVGDTIKFKAGTTISRTEQPNTTESTTGSESGAANYDYHWAWKNVRGVIVTTYLDAGNPFDDGVTGLREKAVGRATIDGEGCDALNLGRVKIRDKNNKLSYSIGYATSDSKGNENEFHNLKFYSSSDIAWYNNDSYLVHIWDMSSGFYGSAWYTVFKNCEIDASKMAGREEDNESFTLAASHTTVQDCYIHGTGIQRSGLYMNGEYNKVIRNTIKGFYSAGIKFNHGGKNGQISHNLIINGGTSLILGEGAENNNVFSNLIIWTSTGTGYKHSIELTGNKQDSDNGARHNKIINNTVIINGAAGAVSGLTMWGGNPNITGLDNGNEVKNNLFYIYNQSTAYLIRMYDYWRDPQSADYNLFYSNNNYRFYDDPNGAWNGFTLWKSRYNTEVNSIVSDPMFTSHSSNSENPSDYILTLNSPAINNGTSITLHNGTTLTDFYGNPVSGGVDIGAFQYQSGLVPVANFSVDDSTPSTSQTVLFADASTNSPTSWLWSFSPTDVSYVDGTSSTSQNPHVKFNSETTYTCTLRVSNSVGSDENIKVNSVTVSNPLPQHGVTLNVSLFLAGCYNSSNMSTGLNDKGFLPASHLFNIAPWNYPGSEIVENGFSENIVDWVLVEVRAEISSSSSIVRKAALINLNGKISEVDRSGIYFQDLLAGEYYIVVYHRNHLSVMSAEKVYLSSANLHYDFRDSQSKAYGTNPMQDLGDGNFGMYSGDGNSDGVISNSDIQDIWIPEFLNSVDGYLEGDFDMDGSVTASDNNIHWLPNNGKSITFP